MCVCITTYVVLYNYLLSKHCKEISDIILSLFREPAPSFRKSKPMNVDRAEGRESRYGVSGTFRSHYAKCKSPDKSVLPVNLFQRGLGVEPRNGSTF